MKTILVLLIFINSSAFADDGWFCSDEASKRTGNTWLSCGMGQGLTEDYARRRALDNAVHEFQTLCDMATDCKNQPRTVEPRRQSCSVDKNGTWKCVRMIAFILGT